MDKVVYWCKRSANQGNQHAQYKLARIYQDGDGIDINMDEAIYWYEKSAEQGNQKAQNSVAQIYQYGKGTNKDINKAIYWHTKSAEQGNIEARYNLNRIHHEIDKDEGKSFHLMKNMPDKEVQKLNIDLPLCMKMERELIKI